MNEYPRDMVVLYAQGHSVVRFLLTRWGADVVPVPPAGAEGVIPTKLVEHDPHQKLLRFLDRGMAAGWDKAANEVYGFESVDALEAAWLESLRTPPARPRPAAPAPARPPVHLGEPELIPPAKLPGGGPRR